MAERLERLPASVERDWMLGEVRRRAVDVEIGTGAMPLRPLVTAPEPFDESPAPKPAPRRPQSRPKAVAKAQPTPTLVRLAVSAPPPAPAETPLPEGLVLSLEDDVLLPPEQPESIQALAPWTRGLRG